MKIGILTLDIFNTKNYKFFVQKYKTPWVSGSWVRWVMGLTYRGSVGRGSEFVTHFQFCILFMFKNWNVHKNYIF